MRSRRNNRKKIEIGAKIKNLFKQKFVISISILIFIIILLVIIILIRQAITRNKIKEEARRIEEFKQEIFIEEEEEFVEEENKVLQTYKAKIAATGDILCQMNMIYDAKTGDDYDFTHMFSNITSFIKKSDIAFGTLETNFVDLQFSNSKKNNSPIQFLNAIKESGIGMVSVAHNHMLDYGVEGLNTTISNIKKEGIEVTGIKNDDTDFTGNIQTVNNIKIAFLAYTYGLSSGASEVTDEEKESINIYSEEKVKKDIEYAKENSNFIIVIMHWGEINSQDITDQQKEWTKFLIDNGVDMIIGSHPSVVEPMEIVQTEEGKNVLVAYSLGNFISTLEYKNADVELILNITIFMQEGQEKATLQTVDYTPIYMLDNGSKAEDRYELVDLKKLIKDYANGDTSKISKATYDSLVAKLENLQEIVNKLK